MLFFEVGVHIVFAIATDEVTTKCLDMRAVDGSFVLCIDGIKKRLCHELELFSVDQNVLHVLQRLFEIGRIPLLFFPIPNNSHERVKIFFFGSFRLLGVVFHFAKLLKNNLKNYKYSNVFSISNHID